MIIHFHTSRAALCVVLALLGCGSEPSADAEGGEPTIEECLAESEPSSCEAIGCIWRDTLTVDSATCEATPAQGRCFTLEGQPVGQAEEFHAYHRMQDGQLELMLYGYDCATPLGWTECDSSMSSPTECACLCSMMAGTDPVFCGESPLCD